MPTLTKRRSSSSPTARFKRMHVETLEQRLLLYAASGYRWASPNVSFSFVPEGANVEGHSNVLFSKLNAIAPTDVWQREFARALQTWANVSNLNFREVADSGLASGTSGSAQGDSRFGDIRLAAHALGGPLAYAYYPSGGSNTITGDVFLATEHWFQVGADYDLYSVLLHEVGHSLGLGHSSGAVMNSYYLGVLSGLTADDIAGIQSIYGARQHDAFDSVASNNAWTSATALTVGSDGTRSAAADLQSLADVDYYALTAPTNSTGSFTVTVSSANLSLLAPKTAIYNSAGVLLATTANTGRGSSAQLTISGVAAGEVLYVMADGATVDEFGMGAYNLQLAFGVDGSSGGGGGGDDGGGGTPAPTPTADPYEVNNTLATATNLGKFNSKSVTDATLHNSTDVDYYRFSAQKSGTFQISTVLDGGSGSHLAAYDSAGRLLAESTSGSISISLATGATANVRVSSPTGAVDAYDLFFSRSGGGGGGGGKGKVRPLEPDNYYASAADVPGDHDHGDHSDFHDADAASLAGFAGAASDQAQGPCGSLTVNEASRPSAANSRSLTAPGRAEFATVQSPSAASDARQGTGDKRRGLANGSEMQWSDAWQTAADEVAGLLAAAY
jgi:hypothetical protein